MKKWFYIIRLSVFPLLQWAGFVAGLLIWRIHPVQAILWFGVTSVALCFSVHVTFHEAVHQKWFQGTRLAGWADSVMTLFMGLPLNGYRWHHFNHHRHTNTLEDYSCTWIKTTQGIVPQSLWRYVLGWPVQLRQSQDRMNQEEAVGLLPHALAQKMAFERRLLQTALVILAVVSWPWALAYIGCVYVGWALVALENYAQHPPITYGVDSTASYYDVFYNALFCKNGFHAEHHRTTSVPWPQLTRQGDAHEIKRPYLIDAFFPRDKNSSSGEPQ